MTEISRVDRSATWLKDHAVPGGGYLTMGTSWSNIRFTYSDGPLMLDGNIDRTTLSADAQLTLRVPTRGDVKLASVYGSLKDGIGFPVHTAPMKGTFRLYLKNGNEIWFSYDASSALGNFDRKDLQLTTV